MSWSARIVGVVAFVLLLAAGAWPTVGGTVGFTVAGLIALLLFLFLLDDDMKRGAA